MSKNWLRILIITLAAATALIHISLALPLGMELWMFYLNGLGYLVLAAALYLPQLKKQQSLIRWALIGFTAVTVIAWGFIGQRDMVATIDKIIEVALIVLLLIEARQTT